MVERSRRKTVALTVLLVLSPWLLVQGWILVDARPVTHTSMPACPDNMMNCASLSAFGTYRMDAALVTTIEANVSEVWNAWAAWVDDEGLNEVLEEVGDDDVHFGHAVAITPFWRFPDDVVVQFEPADEDTAITLYSSSRLGYSDLGVNPARLESLHSALVAVQATR